MARRQKRPTNEELIEKLTERLSEVEKKLEDHLEKSKENEEKLEELKKKQVYDVGVLKEETEKSLVDVREIIESQTVGFRSDIDKLTEGEKKIETNLENLKQEYEIKIEEMQTMHAKDVVQLKEENVRSLRDLKDNIETDCDKLKASIDDMSKKINFGQSNTLEEMSSSKEIMLNEVNSIKENVEFLANRVDELSEKLYDFEQSKRNNLIFYGVPSEKRETPRILLQKVMMIIRGNLMLKRDIVIKKACRIHTGPEVSGCRPLLVTFEDFKDREEVLRKASMLKGSNIRVTEDMSRRVRESREELRRFMRVVKKKNPSASCFIQYDKLYIDNKVYIFNDLRGKVVEFSQDTEEEKPGTVMNGDLCYSSLSSSPVKKYSSSPLQRSLSLYLDDEDKRDSKIKELEEALQNAEKRQRVDREEAEEVSRKHKEAERRVKEMEALMEKLRNKLALCGDSDEDDYEHTYD